MVSLFDLQEKLRARRTGRPAAPAAALAPPGVSLSAASRLLDGAGPPSNDVAGLLGRLRTGRAARRAATATRLRASLALLSPAREPPAAPAGIDRAALPRAYTDLPDGGWVRLGRATTGPQDALAVHHRPGRDRRALRLIDGQELPWQAFAEAAEANEDDLVLLAALAADMGSPEARAAYAALPALPPAPPPLSNRAVVIGSWELLHDRNTGTIQVCRAHLMGPMMPDERTALGRLGLGADLYCARGPYTAERWEELKTWARASRSVQGGHEPVPLSTRVAVAAATRPALSRMRAAERIADVLRLRDYTAEVVAPGGATGPVRIVVGREKDPRTLGRYDTHARGSIWVLLDGRLRIAPAGPRDEDEGAEALEQIAVEALGGEPIAPVPPAADTVVGPLRVVQDDSGGWFVRGVDATEGGEMFPTEARALGYARRVAPLREAHRLADLVMDATPPASAAAAGVNLDFSRAEIRSWYEGAPRVVLPFTMRTPDGERRGELAIHESITKDAPGYLSYLQHWITTEGEPWGAHTLGERDHRSWPWVREVMGKLLAAVPVQAVDFDGARVGPTAQGMVVHFDDEPSERVRSGLRRGKFRRADPNAWVWVRDRSDDRAAWWWARHVAYQAHQERAHARDADEAPRSLDGPVSHQRHETAERVRGVQNSLRDMEARVRHRMRSLLRSETFAEDAEREASHLHRERDLLQEVTRTYRDDGTRRPMGEPSPEQRDFSAPLPSSPKAVARGIEVWEHGGRVYVRLAAEPGERLASSLHLQGFTRSRKTGQAGWWWHPASALGRYWAHAIAEHESDIDARRPELLAERFADKRVVDAVPVEPTMMPSAPALAAEDRIVTVPMRDAARVVRLAVGGQDTAAWEQAAREALGEGNEQERELVVVVARDRILRIEAGRVVEDDWLRAYKRAWGYGRRTLLAARLFADQPLVAAAAVMARELRERSERPKAQRDSDLVADEALDALLPARLPAAERVRGRRALSDALVALGLAHRTGFANHELRVKAPAASPSAWGWLLRHEMRRDRRREAPEAWALHESLAARLLGYDEHRARIAMSAAYAEGWVEPVQVAGEPRLRLGEASEVAR